VLARGVNLDQPLLRSGALGSPLSFTAQSAFAKATADQLVSNQGSRGYLLLHRACSAAGR